VKNKNHNQTDIWHTVQLTTSSGRGYVC